MQNDAVLHCNTNIWKKKNPKPQIRSLSIVRRPDLVPTLQTTRPRLDCRPCSSSPTSSHPDTATPSTTSRPKSICLSPNAATSTASLHLNLSPYAATPTALITIFSAPYIGTEDEAEEYEDAKIELGPHSSVFSQRTT